MRCSGLRPTDRIPRQPTTRQPILESDPNPGSRPTVEANDHQSVDPSVERHRLILPAESGALAIASVGPAWWLRRAIVPALQVAMVRVEQDSEPCSSP